MLADHGNYSSVVVSIVDKSGNQTVCGACSYNVILTSSHNSSVGGFGHAAYTTMTISGSSTNNVVWSVPFTSTFVTGTTLLTVSATDLQPDTGNITTFGPVPSKIAISSLFSAVPADGTSHPALQVSLEDSLGGPAVAPTPVTVYLSSSQTGIAQVSSPIVISPGDSAAVAEVTTTSVGGAANITAYTNSLSSGYTSASTLVSTVTPSPSAIGAYLTPSTLAPSPAQAGGTLLLQLQSSSGEPAKARLPTTLTVTSSDTSVFNRTLQVTINQSASYATVPIVPLRSGSTTFTVSSPGLASASVKLEVLASPFASQLSAAALSIFTNETSGLTVTVTIDGQGVSGADVTWSATGGAVAPSSSVTNGQGQATATFSPRQIGVGNVTAVVTSPYGGARTFHTYIIVSAVPVTDKTSLFGTLLSFPYVLVMAGAVAAAVVLVALFIIRRRRRSTSAPCVRARP